MKAAIYWRHERPIRCPKRRPMIWLGSLYWICEKCHTIYVQVEESQKGMAHE